MTVGERLKNLRKQKGLSQQELSRQIGINRSTYARYETDDNQADYETLQKLADFFDTSIDYLLGRTDDQTGQKRGNEETFYPDGARDLQALIRDNRAIHFGGEQLQLDEEEQAELLRHMRLAWMMIKEKRQEKALKKANLQPPQKRERQD